MVEVAEERQDVCGAEGGCQGWWKERGRDGLKKRKGREGRDIASRFIR